MSRRTKNIAKGQQQNGFSLVEMMVAMTLGMIAISGAIAMFASSVQSNGEGLKQIMLNQELRALMEVMARDIPRAGYWQNADGTTANPFHTMIINGSCITYSYDTSDAPGVAAPENEDSFGFRLSNNTLQIRTSSAACGDATNWDAISTNGVIRITELTFTPACANRTSTARTCLKAGNADDALTGDILANFAAITITLKGELVSDATVKLALSETITERNTQTAVSP